MCNLYGVRATAAEIRGYFEAAEQWRREIHDTQANFAGEVYPGYPGLVLAGDTLRSMVWGFPRKQVSKKTGAPIKPRPVNNARADQLLNPKGMWLPSFLERRCLIPVTEFAEAEGESGNMTRTWFSLPDQPVFAVAGIWRLTSTWGPAYSMVMTEACVHVLDVHDRMPVILRPDQWRAWMDGPPDEARELCVPYAGEMIVSKTQDPWRIRA